MLVWKSAFHGFASFLAPQALQVGRQAAGPRAADQQVAAELEVQRGQRGVRLPAAKALQPFVGRERIGLAGTVQRQAHTPEVLLMVRDVRGFQRVVAG